MALEISVVASANRLQQANANNYVIDRTATDASRANSQQDFQRIVAEERRAEDVAREADRIRYKREDIRADIDRRQIDDLRVRQLEDRRIEDRIQQQVSDNKVADAEAQFRKAQLNEIPTPFAPGRPPLTSTQPAPDDFQQYLADRNVRRLEQRSRESDLALEQQVQLRRSERAIAEFRANPGALAGTVERGAVVDVQA